jgi:hypothetical protein
MEERIDLSFFDSAYANFLSAANAASSSRRYYRLGRLTFCLYFANHSLVDILTRALKHLEVESTRSDLTICLWDSVSTNTPPIQMPWHKGMLQFRGEVSGVGSDRVYIVVDIHTKALNVWDRVRNIGLFWIENYRDLPWWACGSPLQLILHWWLRSHGHQLTHVAAVGYPNGGILLLGKSGSGKSTMTLACMKVGMKYVGEDYCVLSDFPYQAYSIYHSSKLKEKTLDWFPELGCHVTNPNRMKGDKALLFHHEFQPENILMSCPIKALVILKIEETQKSWLETINPKEALGPLSATTLWQLTHTGPEVFHHLRKLAESLPCYCLHMGDHLIESAEQMKGLL